MNILAIERSSAPGSAALFADGAVEAVPGSDAGSGQWTVAIADFLESKGLSFSDLDMIAVGTGPGSFAGVRSAISFAKGVEAGLSAMRAGGGGVAGFIAYGMPSAAAFSQEGRTVAVVGDARRGLFWTASYRGAECISELRAVGRGELPGAVPEDAEVVTPDGARIGGVLEEMFGPRYCGNALPSAARLAEIAAARPDLALPDPLPAYLTPAVRT